MIVTATRSGQEGNETVFYEHFLDALKNAAADEDKDKKVSVWEAFKFATAGTERFYKEEGRLATEHPQISDNGAEKVGHHRQRCACSGAIDHASRSIGRSVVSDPRVQALLNEKKSYRAEDRSAAHQQGVYARGRIREATGRTARSARAEKPADSRAGAEEMKKNFGFRISDFGIGRTRRNPNSEIRNPKSLTLCSFSPFSLLSCGAFWQTDADSGYRTGAHRAITRTRRRSLEAGGRRRQYAMLRLSRALYYSWIRQGEYTKAGRRFEAWSGQPAQRRADPSGRRPHQSHHRQLRSSAHSL